MESDIYIRLPPKANQTEINSSDQNRQLEILQIYLEAQDKIVQLINEGNAFAQNNKFDDGLKTFVSALQLILPEHLESCPAELLQDFLHLKNTIYNNIAICHFNLGDYNEAIGAAKEVLNKDPNNIKAYFILSNIHEAMGELEDAYNDITNAFNLQQVTGYIEREIMEKYQSLKYQFTKTKKSQSIKSVKQEQESELQKSEQNKNQYRNEIFPQDLDKSTSSSIVFSATQVVFSGTAAAVLATSVTKFILGENPKTQDGILQSFVIGGNLLFAIVLKKQWQKLTFAAITAGTIYFLLYKKSKRSQ